MAQLEGAYEQVGQRLTSIDTRLDTLDRKVDLVRDELGTKIDGLNAKNDQRFMWSVGIFVPSWATTIASIYMHH
jgi:uncharacterized Rmd1/YagE family protein